MGVSAEINDVGDVSMSSATARLLYAAVVLECPGHMYFSDSFSYTSNLFCGRASCNQMGTEMARRGSEMQSACDGRAIRNATSAESRHRCSEQFLP